VWVGDANDFFAPPMPGDFNADGAVDEADLALWQAGVGVTGSATHWQGDADGDADVDGADLLLWQQNLGATSATPPAAVPEPAAVIMGLMGLCALCARWRTKGSGVYCDW
jgi:hypothetical protein